MVKLRLRRKKFIRNKAQLELNIGRPVEQDRNHHLGGKSFYFFDFDDNVAYLTTPIAIFHKKTNEEILLSSGQWAQYHHEIGKTGTYKDYLIDYDEDTGSFRFFRDQRLGLFGKIRGKRQKFLHDIEEALNNADYTWKAPSWNCFFHATYNRRPISVITARGHDGDTIKNGINLMVKDGHLPYPPNFLSIYPVTNPMIRKDLGDTDLTMSVADLKRKVIRRSVEEALELYGYSPHHRFGMSDDDPKNVELITEEMKALKRDFPEMSFFVIQTFKDKFVKTEVLQHKTKRNRSNKDAQSNQLLLF